MPSITTEFKTYTNNPLSDLKICLGSFIMHFNNNNIRNVLDPEFHVTATKNVILTHEQVKIIPFSLIDVPDVTVNNDDLWIHTDYWEICILSEQDHLEVYSSIALGTDNAEFTHLLGQLMEILTSA